MKTNGKTVRFLSKYMALSPQTAYPLTREGEMELIRRIKRGGSTGKAARNIFIEAYLWLAVSFASRTQQREAPLADLIQEGTVGLMRALDRFDPTQGYRFSTYATWWLRSYMGKARAENGTTVSRSLYIINRINRVNLTREQFANRTGKRASLSDIVEESGLSKKDIARALFTQSQVTVSLDGPVSEHNDTLLQHTVKDGKTPSPFELVYCREMFRQTGWLLGNLRSRERLIIHKRFGIGKEKEHSLKEVGEILGLSRERVRQLEKKTLSRLRKLCETRDLDFRSH